MVPARAGGASRAGGVGPRSLVEFLVWAVGVVHQQLARRELAAIDGFVFPQLVHQLLSSVRVCVPEGTCRGQRDTSVPRKREASRCLKSESTDFSQFILFWKIPYSLSAGQRRTLLPACPPAPSRCILGCCGDKFWDSPSVRRSLFPVTAQLLTSWSQHRVLPRRPPSSEGSRSMLPPVLVLLLGPKCPS